MTKLILSSIATVLAVTTLMAQVPQSINYQGVARDNTGSILASQSIALKISILSDSTTGTVEYSETHTTITNQFGLFTLQIGNGTVVSGNFSTIDWGANTHYAKVEMDETGSTNYQLTGTSQLLSVPYALHAKTAETVTGAITETDPVFGVSAASGITGTDTTYWNNKQEQLTAGSGIAISGNVISTTGGSAGPFYLRQDTLGGIVYYIYIGNDGQQHGLIVAKTESTAQWQTSGTTTNANRSWDGAYNTALMTNSPAKTWITSNFSSDWYLPSVDELSILWQHRFHVNKAMNDGSFTLLSTNTDRYWSSTETNTTNAWYFDCSVGTSWNVPKTTTYSVRAVRAF